MRFKPKSSSSQGSDDAFLHRCEELLRDVARAFKQQEHLLLIEVLGIPIADPRRMATLALYPQYTLALPLVIRRDDCLAGSVLMQGHGGQYREYPSDRDHYDRPTADRTGKKAPRLLDAHAALVYSLMRQRQSIGLLVIEVDDPACFAGLHLNDLDTGTIDAATLRQGNNVDMGMLNHAIAALAQHLSQPAMTAIIAHAAEFLPWMDAVQRRLGDILDPKHHFSFYDQILQIARRIPSKSAEHDLSAAILLIRKEQSFEPTSVHCPPRAEEERHWFVLTHKVGDLVSPPEPQWHVIDRNRHDPNRPHRRPGPHGSITGRTIKTGQSQRVDQVEIDDDYISSGDRFNRGSELNCLLQDRGNTIGAIAVLSEKRSDFDVHDLAHMDIFCERVAPLLWRNSLMGVDRRSNDQFHFARKMVTELESLLQFQLGAPPPDFDGIRKTIRKKIVLEAKKRTGAEVGVIAQIIESERFFDMVETGNLKADFKKMPITDGAMGEAYRQRHSQVIPSIADWQKQGKPYIPGFADVATKSELIALPPPDWPLDFMLNVESEKDYHFSAVHLRWAEYLIEEAVIAEALIRQGEQSYQGATREIIDRVTRAIASMRHFNFEQFETQHPELNKSLRGDQQFHDLKADYINSSRTREQRRRDGRLLQLYILRLERDRLLSDILNTLSMLTANARCTIWLATNTYIDIQQNMFDFDNGKLSSISTVPPSAAMEHRSIDLQRFETNRRLLDGHPVKVSRIQGGDFFDLALYDTQAQMLIPLVEGARFSGFVQAEFADTIILNNEAQQQVVTMLANLCASVITANDLRLSELQFEVIREFELEIARGDLDPEASDKGISDLGAVVSKALRGAHAITSITAGWGALCQIKSVAGELQIQGAYVLPFSGIFTSHHAWADEVRPVTPTNAADTAIVDAMKQLFNIPAIQDAIKGEKPYLLLDTYQDMRQQSPLPTDARSFLCLPCFIPERFHIPEDEEQSIFIIASHRPNFINDSDRQILQLLTQNLAVGITNIEARYSRQHLLLDLQQHLDRTSNLPQRIVDVRKLLAEASRAMGSNKSMDDAIKGLDDIIGSLMAIPQLLIWYSILVKPYAMNTTIANTAHDGVFLKEVEHMREPIQSFVKLYGRYLDWQPLHDDIVLATDATDLQAIIFGCIEYAVQQGTAHGVIAVKNHLDQEKRKVTITISFTGESPKDPHAPSGMRQLYAAAAYIGCQVIQENAHTLSISISRRPLPGEHV